MTDLISAVKSADLEAVQACITACADLNARDEDGKTALIYAAKRGHVKIVDVLIAAGAEVNAEDSKGLTAFGHVVRYGQRYNHACIEEALLDAGAE
jgi:uncharacterized protein